MLKQSEWPHLRDVALQLPWASKTIKTEYAVWKKKPCVCRQHRCVCNLPIRLQLKSTVKKWRCCHLGWQMTPGNPSETPSWKTAGSSSAARDTKAFLGADPWGGGRRFVYYWGNLPTNLPRNFEKCQRSPLTFQPHSSPSVPSATALPCDASATRDCQGAQIASTFGVLGQWSLDLLQWRGLKTSRIHEHHKLRESAVNNKTWAPRCPNWCLHNQTYLNNISEREVHVWDII